LKSLSEEKQQYAMKKGSVYMDCFPEKGDAICAASYINDFRHAVHSTTKLAAQPNCVLVEHTVNWLKGLYLKAVRNIEVGEELFYDYGWQVGDWDTVEAKVISEKFNTALLTEDSYRQRIRECFPYFEDNNHLPLENRKRKSDTIEIATVGNKTLTASELGRLQPNTNLNDQVSNE